MQKQFGNYAATLSPTCSAHGEQQGEKLDEEKNRQE
jgi:hypothetical protein